MARKKKFETQLRERLLEIVGKQVELFRRPSNCIRIVLKSGTEYWGTVKEVEDDYCVVKVSYTGGGKEDIVIRLSDVASFSRD